MRRRKEEWPEPEEILVMALVVNCGMSIASDEEHERVKKLAGLLVRFLNNMGYTIARAK